MQYIPFTYSRKQLVTRELILNKVNIVPDIKKIN